MKRALAVVLLAVCVPGASVYAQPVPEPVPGQPTPPPAPAADSFEADLDAMVVANGLTADAAAKGAESASPTVTRRASEIEAAIAQLETAELARIPRVSLEASYTRLSYIDPLVLGMNPATGEPIQIPFLQNSYLGRASVGIPLSDYLLRFPKLIDGAKLGVEAARLSQQTGAVDAAHEARIAYYEWIRARLQTMVANRQLTQVRATLKQVKALADAQRVSKADLLRVESQEAQAEQVADQLGQLTELREEQLRILAGIEPSTEIAIGEDFRTDIEADANASTDELLTKAKTQRLEFRSIDTGIQAKEMQKRAEDAAKYPRLSAFASADYANPNQRIFPQSEEFRFTWTAGVQLSWTLNDTLTAKQTQRRITAEQKQLEADRESLSRGTRIQILAAQQAVHVARASMASSAKGLIAAEEAYRVRQALLAAERATALDLVDAETELTRARSSSLNARIDLRVALANLAYATGATSPKPR